MLRLDILTKRFPTKVGDTYAIWCASYVDALGAPMTVDTMTNRRKLRNSTEVLASETFVANMGFTGWSHLSSPYVATYTAVYSRKRKEKAV